MTPSGERAAIFQVVDAILGQRPESGLDLFEDQRPFAAFDRHVPQPTLGSAEATAAAERLSATDRRHVPGFDRETDQQSRAIARAFRAVGYRAARTDLPAGTTRRPDTPRRGREL